MVSVNSPPGLPLPAIPKSKILTLPVSSPRRVVLVSTAILEISEMVSKMGVLAEVEFSMEIFWLKLFSLKIKKVPPVSATVKIIKIRNKKMFFIFLKIFLGLEFWEGELEFWGDIFFAEEVGEANVIGKSVFGGRVLLASVKEGFLSGITFFLLRLSMGFD